MLTRIAMTLLFLLMPALARAQIPARAPDRTLAGTLTIADHQTYRNVPFDVPPGTVRLVVALDYDTKDQKTVIDLGVADQHGMRGSSGGNKPSLTIAESDATPSYLPGRLEPGPWQLVLAIPNIRTGITAHWTARLWFLKATEAEALRGPVINRGAGWYRGDFHLHTAHSDGTCASQSGAKTPCPLYKTLETAAARGLDFIAVTDHNTTSHLAAMREAQPYFDRLLLIPGREITTFYGHFNVFGVTEPIDFRITPGGAQSFNAIADRVHALGGLVSINHPALPSGELCMGCGWTMPDADVARADAVEVANGGTIATFGGQSENAFSGVPFWRRALAQTGRMTAIGGSDNHDGSDRTDRAGTVGRPTTVVYADGLSVSAILAAVRRGRVFVDLVGDPTSMLDVGVSVGRASAAMGSTLAVRRRDHAQATIHAAAPPNSRVDLLVDDIVSTTAAIPADDRLILPLALTAGRHAVRTVVRGGDKKLLLLSNAVTIDVR